FHEYLVGGKKASVNPIQSGTKAAARYERMVAPGRTVKLQLRLSALVGDHPLEAPFADFDAMIEQRRDEADAFYAAINGRRLSDDAKLHSRQALARFVRVKTRTHI